MEIRLQVNQNVKFALRPEIQWEDDSHRAKIVQVRVHLLAQCFVLHGRFSEGLCWIPHAQQETHRMAENQKYGTIILKKCGHCRKTLNSNDLAEYIPSVSPSVLSSSTCLVLTSRVSISIVCSAYSHAQTSWGFISANIKRFQLYPDNYRTFVQIVKGETAVLIF